MAAYNVEIYIGEAIESVINQTYSNWELLVVDNASADGTVEQIQKYCSDNRITLLREIKQGVSFARNRALETMQGDFFCFLDGDDIMPAGSIESRLSIFRTDPDLYFVDGRVQYVDEALNLIKKSYSPDYSGYPFQLLLRLDERCLCGNTWMIKRELLVEYQFQTDMTHAEDLYFYLTISKGKKYSFTNEIILKYRQRQGSAMRSLSGLESGYLRLLEKVDKDFPGEKVLYLKLRIIRIMFLSWLINGKNPVKAVISIFKFLK